MTRKEFIERTKEIMASTVLTREEKERRIRHTSTRLIEDTIWRFPEMRDWRMREEAAIKTHAGHGGFSYCPESGNWYPERPPVIKALDLEWEGFMQQKINETFQKAWTGKAA